MEDMDQALDTGSLCQQNGGIALHFAFKVSIEVLCRPEMSNPIQFLWLDNFATENMPFSLQRVVMSRTTLTLIENLPHCRYI